MTRAGRLSAILALILFVAAPASATVLGPSFPPDGGTVDFAFSGGPSPADSGGLTVEFTNFAMTTGWMELYWGPSGSALPTAGLDGSSHSLTFSGSSGTVGTWAGTTDWTDPFDSTTYNNVPIEMRIDITGLGGAPWILSTSVTDLDPGPGTGIGAVVDNTSGLDFDANVQFLADIPTDGGTGFIALNDVQTNGGQTVSSFSGGFYSVVPEPGTALLLGFGMAGLAAMGSRRRLA